MAKSFLVQEDSIRGPRSRSADEHIRVLYKHEKMKTQSDRLLSIIVYSFSTYINNYMLTYMAHSHKSSRMSSARISLIRFGAVIASRRNGSPSSWLRTTSMSVVPC